MAAQVVEKALEELQTNITLLDLGNIIINTLLVFVVLFLLITIFHLSIYISLIPAIIYFIISLGFLYYKNKYLAVEEKVPELNEQLRTVADNVHRTNPIVDSLKEDVVRNMSKVRTSYFVDYSTISVKILLLTIVSVLVVITSFLNVSFDFGFNIPLFNNQGIRLVGQDTPNISLSYLEGNLSDIMGANSIAKLGTKQLNLIIRPLESDADLNSVKQVTKENFNTPTFPKEIYTSYDVAYNDKIAKENQKLVKDYFEQITR